jgi:hypothetical protein
MKRVLMLSLVALQGMAVADSNNRTFFVARPHLSNMPMTHATFFSSANQDNPGFGGGMQITPFFEQSTEKAKLGNYFSFTKNNSIVIKGAAALAGLNQADANADALPGNFALDRGYDGKVTFNPKRTSYGVHINYQQDLSFLLDNLYLGVAAPIVTIEHDLGLTEQVTANPGAYKFSDAMAGRRLTSDFSEPVKFAKINGKQRVTGLADVEVGVGYRFLNTDRYRVQAEVNVTAPTGAAPSGTQMFEAVVGSNAWALGAGLGGRVNVWQNRENEDNRFSIWANADIKYLFQNTQMRTLGIKDKAGAQYARMRQQDPATPANVLANSVPGVNAMTRSVNVTPGVLAEGMLWGDFTWNAWKFGAGYNVFGRQAEKVALRGNFTDGGTYGLSAPLVEVPAGAVGTAGANYMSATTMNAHLVGPLNGVNPTGGAIRFGNGGANEKTIADTSYFLPPTQISAGPAIGVGHANTAAGGIQGGVDSNSTIKQNGAGVGAAQVACNGTFLAASDVDLQPAASAISHKLAAQVSYALNTDNPSYVGLGGGYEFAGSNDLNSGMSFWCKFGITF